MSLSLIMMISSFTLTNTDFHFPIVVAVIGVLVFSVFFLTQLLQNYITYSLKRST